MSNIISVSQFNKYIHDILNAEEILHNIEIYGEISGIKMSGNALYFNVKDNDSLLSCVKFGVLDTDYSPKEGEMVLLRGSPNFYIKGGRFSFNVNRMTPYGQGLLYQQFLELKAKLEKLGLFAPERKKSLPDVIRRIGVVSSETGAVIHDIMDIAHRRNPMLDIVLYPAKVQGVGADITIAKGIKELDKTNVDIIIVARGGGSLEDLSCFNTEIVAMAIADCKKPVISAVGHETDFTIADFVADLRAPTPSAAAELVSVDMANLSRILSKTINRLIGIVGVIYDNYQNKIITKTKTINQCINNKLSLTNKEICAIIKSLQYNANMCFINKERQVDIITQKLDGVSPIKILKMGYGLILDSKDNLLTNIKKVNIGDKIKVKLDDGHLDCEVQNKGD